MSPRSFTDVVLHSPPLIRTTDTVEAAVRQLLESAIPALPVVDERGAYKGIFGEREFMSALFPGYLNQLQGAAFLSRSIDDALEKRDSCRQETVEGYLNTEHVDVGPDYSDTQVAEIFLHHRVLIIPVVDDGQVRGVITRRDFFRAIAERFLEGPGV
jgi:CBS domain-containing protein